MELYPTVPVVAFLRQGLLWLRCPVIFDKSLHRARGDSSVWNQSNVARGHTRLAGLRELGKDMKGIDLDLKGQAEFQHTQA